MKRLVTLYISLLNQMRSVPPLLFRLVLAYGFYGPAMMKLSNIESVAEWFGSMGIPAPLLNAYMAAGTEILGVVLLTLGLATRFISVPLIFVMFVAIGTVHFTNGFECGKNGFEVPFYYVLMLLSLMVTGAGAISLDHLIARRFEG